MNSVEFGKKCRPYNKAYYAMFGEVPSPSDYACSNDEFLEIMRRCVEKKIKIDVLLHEVKNPKGAKQ